MLDLLKRKEGDKILESFISGLRQQADSSHSQIAVDWDNLWNNIQQSAMQKQGAVVKMKWVFRAAAIVLIIGAAIFYLNTNPGKTATKAQNVQVSKTHDIQPGGNKAILTLANGSQIILDDASSGTLAQQGNAQILKGAQGELIYKETGERVMEVLYNTVTTQRGGEYKLVLPDGSAVWLNAISSIRYPTAFIGKDRVVEITGEAYFEVAKDKMHPFRVMVKSRNGGSPMEVSVLGTEFNINSYTDELAIKTTLLNGSVKVINGAATTTLKPGQQTELSGDGTIKVISNANVNEAVAWKEGRFEFHDADLKTILRQIMRWYDVEVEYQSAVSVRYFTATISRHKTLSGLLNILRQSDVDIKLEGKKLIVKP